MSGFAFLQHLKNFVSLYLIKILRSVELE